MIALAILRAIPARSWFAPAVVAGIIAIGVAIYLKGRDDAGSAAKDTTIETLRERAKVNDETNTADDSALCRALGGVFNHAENKCM